MEQASLALLNSRSNFRPTKTFRDLVQNERYIVKFAFRRSTKNSQLGCTLVIAEFGDDILEGHDGIFIRSDGEVDWDFEDCEQDLCCLNLTAPYGEDAHFDAIERLIGKKDQYLLISLKSVKNCSSLIPIPIYEFSLINKKKK